jgi:hypothetical protein
MLIGGTGRKAVSAALSFVSDPRNLSVGAPRGQIRGSESVAAPSRGRTSGGLRRIYGRPNVRTRNTAIWPRVFGRFGQ